MKRYGALTKKVGTWSQYHLFGRLSTLKKALRVKLLASLRGADVNWKTSDDVCNWLLSRLTSEDKHVPSLMGKKKKNPDAAMEWLLEIVNEAQVR